MGSIGIDFGTTKTIVSWYDPQFGKAEPVKCFDHAEIVPTQVFIKNDGEFVFGDEAEMEGMVDPLGIFGKFKLKLGSPDVLITRRVDGRVIKLTARDLTRRFLEFVRNMCLKKSDLKEEDLDGAVITAPVAFSISQQKELLEAAKDAGFSNVRIALEPEAAAIAYLKAYPSDDIQRALVVDWGGGTLDTALVEKTSNGRFVCDGDFSRGLVDVGGEELDRKFQKFVEDKFRDRGAEVPSLAGIDDVSDEEAAIIATERYKLQKGILHDKCKLDDFEKCVFYPQGGRGVSIRHSVEITRQDYKSQILGELRNAVDLVCGIIDELPKDRMPEKILLAGGTCRSKVIQDALREATGLEVVEWRNHSREAVALGAAYLSSGGEPSCRQQPKSRDVSDVIDQLNIAIGNEHWKEAACIVSECGDIQDAELEYLIAQYYEGSPNGNLLMAFKHYQSAAENGCVAAMYKVGCICRWESGWWFETENVVREDPEFAFVNFKAAAERKHQEAMVELANCYLDGYGCEPSKGDAIFWLKEAASSGNESAKNELEKIS